MKDSEKKNNSIGERIRELRRNARYSQAYVAEALNMKRSTYARLEICSDDSIKPKYIRALAEFYNVLESDIWGYSAASELGVERTGPAVLRQEPNLFEEQEFIPTNIEIERMKKMRQLPMFVMKCFDYILDRLIEKD